MPLPRLNDHVFNEKHHPDKGQRIDENMRRLELLKIEMDAKAHPVRATEKLDNQHDLPDDRNAVSRGDRKPGRQLRQHDMTEPRSS